jgi:uncharacterized protein (DUF2126 family)/transglutaminase-like putative cysteine protease
VSILVAIEHRTSYRFDRMVRLGPHVVRLRPTPHTRTPIRSYSLRVEPAEHFINWQQDPFGNYLARLVFPEKTRELTVTVDLIADLTVINPFDYFVEEGSTHWPFSYDAGLAQDLAPYLAIAPADGPLVDAWVDAIRAEAVPTSEGWPINDLLVFVNQRLHAALDYEIRMAPGVQTPEETLARAMGSCRDSGWLLVQVLRKLGLAARFVSGYLVQLTADLEALDGPSGPKADFTDLHAWTEVYVPGAGWLGLDPTSGLFAGEGHIPLACTPEPSSAAPIEGVTDVAEVTFEFTNVVTRVREDPRVTLPYSDEQWAAIDALGRAVDEDLLAGDVRLTVGGEPTFVSIDDMEGAEWNTEADGAAKRLLASELSDRLARRFAPGALVHHGQGKWYPGEPLPRWQIGIFWRADGSPIWSDPALLADPHRPGSADASSARPLADALAGGLGLDPGSVIAAYEDPLWERWQAALDGATTTLDGSGAASSDLTPTGFVLPLALDPTGAWRTSRWTLRRGELFVLSGDSPLGLRLPLDAVTEVDPPLDDDTVPTALTVEVRDEHLCVFLPPIDDLDRALDLVGVVEAAVRATGTPVVVEGYPPPRDPSVPCIIVASDPGVIEVNVHPTSSWPELADLVTDLYEEARQSRLGTEKFMLDGLHSGTGGGNHLTIGGPTPEDSPVLRRPDLLRSLITFWQHHPSLSYLFSGRFIGPTSQAPRVDEGRPEALYELEIAFEQLAADPDPPRWLVDRALRHLLVDVTGNTHRAEFCIDKLFSPDTDRGRLGLVELRAFEMPPHARMGLVQVLLVRALIARFWNEPYEGRLVRWGTQLHGRYLLPHHVETDIAEVVDDLNHHGYPFDHAWLAPFLEFRFPRIGTTQIGDVTLSLRHAIEPWLVLGEEVTATATSRYVDSSVERLQIEASGLTPGRHLVTCNRIVIPLQETGRPDQMVAGVRYRAWQPPSALHPTIGVHSPLVFDLVDTWTGRSLGGCTYHVAHPGGRSYDAFPVNANEAEARRASRFWAFGHSPGPLAVAPVTGAGGSDEYPGILDLRRHRPVLS